MRVHRELLETQKLPRRLVTGRVRNDRFCDINAFERDLTCNGTVIIKFHLRISKEEQKRRLLQRLDSPETVELLHRRYCRAEIMGPSHGRL